jgi:hypothetical protein
MASTDAYPVSWKNYAYRVTFPIFDADGDLVPGATGLDSEVSKDGGSFTDCTNEATEIATSSGVYVLDLTATEMSADTVAVIIKTTTSGAKTTVLVLYPQKGGDFLAAVDHWGGYPIATPTILGVPKVDVSHVIGAVQSTGTFDTIKADTAGIAVDVDNLQTRLPTALTVGGRMVSDVIAINGNTDAPITLDRSARSILGGSCAAGSTTTLVNIATIDAGAIANDQFKGRVIIFDRGTLTPALRGQASDIIASAGGGLTVTALTSPPALGDLFVIV